jgi:biopolymer transport protein ExbD
VERGGHADEGHMTFGRLEKPQGHRPMSDINVTPLVDVMLVLLVIFIIAAPVLASRLQLDLPRPTRRWPWPSPERPWCRWRWTPRA